MVNNHLLNGMILQVPPKNVILTTLTLPENQRMSAQKRDDDSVGNTSEPTIDFQGTFVSFQGE